MVAETRVAPHRGAVIKTYRLLVEPPVYVDIIETPDGRLRYNVVEPQPSEIAKKVLNEVTKKIEGDVRLLREFSEPLQYRDAMQRALALVNEIGRKYRRKGFTDFDSRVVAYYIVRDFVGYGRLDPLIRDPLIEDITCDGMNIPVHVFHSEFEWLETNIVFSKKEEFERIVAKLAYRSGQEPTVAKPIVEGVLNPEGYRVHIVLDVVSRRGHSFTIRKFRATPFTIIELINRGTLDPGLAALLWLTVENKQGIIIYGTTGAGKTTLLNALAMLLPPEYKVVTAEDTPEISIPFHENWVAMVTRLSTDQHVQSVTLQAQVESALRQRPDVLILGEIRSREAYSFFQAVSTGHGGLTTIHAENIETLIRRLVAPPMNVPKSLIATARLFIQILRIVLPRGVTRKVVYVHEVDHYDPREDVIVVRTLTKWIRERDIWPIFLSKSSTLKAIAELQATTYDDVVIDLRRRATILYWAAVKGFDIVMLHTIIRRYRRDPDTVYAQALSEAGEYPIRVLDYEEVKVV